MFSGGKNVKICNFGQKKPSDFGEDLFFRDHLLLVGKFVISARKSLRILAKTFTPPILILPPRFREAGDAPGLKTAGLQVPVTEAKFSDLVIDYKVTATS